jgi:predicted dehydrogenase
MSKLDDVNRRNFLRGAAGVGASLGAAGRVFAGAVQKKSPTRVLGANDRINIGVIGTGGRGTYVGRQFAAIGKQDNSCQVVAVCDVYRRRLNDNKSYYEKEYSAVSGTLDWREVVNRPDIDAVIVATPDHWHARIALAAMDNGKDVYLEKPMCHTLEEVRQLMSTVRETKRVVQVGSHTTSAQQWWKAKKAIADGAIGDMLMSQGSYHRNSVQGEWNYKIDEDAGPDGKGDAYIDWKTFLGSAPKHPYDADRFFRFRKYWDYSGGIATDLFFHVAAPMNICWPQPEYPARVMASGGIYGGPAFREKREVPDTFHLVAEYAKGYSVVLTSSMANSQHIPGLIRGHLGTIIMVDHGMFESSTDHITLKPEKKVLETNEDYKTKFGLDEVTIPVEQEDPLARHIRNFLECIRSRQKPTLDVETSARAQVLITMAVMSYREGRVLYFDEKNWKMTPNAPKA